MSAKQFLRMPVTVMSLWLSVFLVGASAQETQPAVGLDDAVGRNFIVASDSTYELFYLTARVVSFDTPAEASEAIPLWLEQQQVGELTRYDLSALRPIAIERVADETQAIVGGAALKTDSDVTAEVAFIAVRDGNVLHLFEAWAQYSSPESTVLDIARRTLGTESLEYDPVPNIEYRTGGLWDSLPRTEHLPAGMTWDGDFVPCVGVLAVAECPNDATPVATPVGEV